MHYGVGIDHGRHSPRFFVTNKSKEKSYDGYIRHKFNEKHQNETKLARQVEYAKRQIRNNGSSLGHIERWSLWR
jgi:hypothetical protein